MLYQDLWLRLLHSLVSSSLSATDSELPPMLDPGIDFRLSLLNVLGSAYFVCYVMPELGESPKRWPH